MNAIIMAAGTSSRFAPLSYELPKGLLNVKGEILIERQIRQLQEAGISDITIVVGYKAELFHYLADKFNVNIVINEDYNQYNNTSSIIRVIDKLENTYICSSDNYFPNNVFIDKSSDSYYSALYANGTTHEYCITADAQDNIISVKVGGADSWYMVGHVFFNKEYSEKFREIMIKEYPNEETKKVYWEDIYIKHIEELPPMKIRYYKPHDIEEFDTLEELRLFDDNYINHTGSKIFQNICSILQCKEMDIYNINVLKKGMTNSSFAFTCQKDGKTYVYRQPGEGTEAFISRKSEYFSMKIAKQLKILQDLGVCYLTLGEATPALSGGEAQRLKLAYEMETPQQGSVFVFDEPTIGLHPQDVKKLVLIFDHLIQLGATVIVIEHDLELVTNCDYIIDMGPWGGTEGGRVVVEGTPEAVAATSESITGRYLKQELAEDK